ncbi:MAG: 50S ribosome-binding GTPase, partial [Lachnospiraceae bacterium]|nr:50S ribosome-binding GTPase [Lachnospiraceae bacterium]
TVILGKPNVGKSSLLNLLLNENRAIVTDIAGTTRDIIKESINLDGITLHIVDTAGLRADKNIDKVEKIGIDKAKDEAKSADLILLVIDSTDDDIKEALSLLEEYKTIPTIILLNKSDLLEKQYKPTLIKDSFYTSRPDIHIIDFSTITKLGFDTLKTTIKDMFIKKDLDFNNQIYISNERQLLSIKDAKTSLQNVISSIDNAMPEDLYTIDLMDAITHLSHVLGEEISDDLANTIFSKFCMGK